MKLKELLAGVLTEEEMKFAPSAFDMVGDIAIIWIPDELKSKEREIGEKLLSFKNLKTVLKRESAVEDEFRVRRYSLLAGEDKRETIYVEYGSRYKVDVTKAYFSPRLGNERERIVGLVQEGEKVLVMFAGIGPYAIQIAKRAKPEMVYAVEINPEAVRYMEENVRLNKVGRRVRFFCGDVREVVPKLEERFDRIIMPLPKDAETFLDVARGASQDGAVIHLYVFAESREDALSKVKEDVEVLDVVECGTYSAKISRYCVDFKFR
ncbi:MAG: class I SAM-dependent methyltransferase family protein [Candidatus Aenigmarchaeota archaeon]|nr:class I SAM-dependent methyltransferase family protein [Candidatus Aenigmarchaeota archaeon]